MIGAEAAGIRRRPIMVVMIAIAAASILAIALATSRGVDDAAFAKAYTDPTDACDSCH